MRYRMLDTPTGPFALIERIDGSLSTRWVSGGGDSILTGGRRDETLRDDLADRLRGYFAGEPVNFSDVPTPPGDPGRGDDTFFSRCWRACRSVPRGQTRTYGQLALMAGSTVGASRAAGAAMRRNPLCIIIPCHRVVAAGGRLGGFGGQADPHHDHLRVKRWLLAMEGALDSVDDTRVPQRGGLLPLLDGGGD